MKSGVDAAVLAALLGALLAPTAEGSEVARGAEPAATPAEVDAVPGDADLSGREIYDRVLQNRFRSYVERSRVLSGDRAARVQETRLEVTWKDFRDAEGQPTKGVLSKTVVKYSYPSDIRHAGYLIINNHETVNDQFVYLPSRRRVRRVNLRGESILGTDLSLEDVVPRELDDATYRRLPDEQIDGIRVFVIEAVPTEEARSEYSRFVVYVDAERYLPLRTRYWNGAGVEIKELRVDTSRIDQIDGVYVPMKSTMNHLLLDSFTSLEVTELEPNPRLGRSVFSLRGLESH